MHRKDRTPIAKWLKCIIAFVVAGVASLVTLAGIVPAAVASTTYTKTTAITDHTDTGHGAALSGAWNQESFTRTATLVNNGPDPDKAGYWMYTMHLSDNNGIFQTLAGADSPSGNGGAINGIVNGTMSGTGDFMFDADAQPTSKPPSQMSGNDLASSTWYQLFFAPSTDFSGPGENAYDYVYDANATCEQWTDSSDVANNDGQSATAGDITGVSQCAPLPVANKLSVKDVCGNFAHRNWTVTDVAGGRAVTFYVSTRLNNGHYYGLGHAVHISAGGSVTFTTVRGGSNAKGIRIGYPKYTASKPWLYLYGASSLKPAC